MGAGILLILVNGLNYIVDVYGTKTANSAIAANTVVRSLFGVVFPLFAAKMYARLGVAWATSLPGFLAAGMVMF
jgi:DHA1 family multidrug resistance protein-like MFS transporter